MSVAHSNDQHSKTSKPGNKDGFTLLELLVVIIILGFLGVVGSLQVVKYLGRAKTDTAKIQISQVSTAVDLFRIDVGRLPTTEETLSVLVEPGPSIEGWEGPYLRTRAAITDPWGRLIQYQQPGQKGEYDLISLGADGRRGGTGEDRDVGNW